MIEKQRMPGAGPSTLSPLVPRPREPLPPRQAPGQARSPRVELGLAFALAGLALGGGFGLVRGLPARPERPAARVAMARPPAAPALPSGCLSERTSAVSPLTAPAGPLRHPIRVAALGRGLFFLYQGGLYRTTLRGAAAEAGGLPVLPRPAGSRRLVAMAASSEGLWLLDQGNRLSRYRPGRGLERLGVLAGPGARGVALAAAQGGPCALDSGQGRLVQWPARGGAPRILASGLAGSRSLAAGPQGLYLVAASGRLMRLASGRPIAAFERGAALALAGEPGFEPSALAAAGDAVFVADARGERLLVLDARTGAPRARLRIALPGLAAPVRDLAAGERLLVLAGNHLVAYPARGDLAGALAAPPDDPQAPPSVPFADPPSPSLVGFRPPLAGAPALPPLRGTLGGLVYAADVEGQPLQPGSPVYAAKDGIVLRADRAFAPPAPAEEARLLAALDRGTLAEREADRLRGPQIVVLHPGGVRTRYAGLAAVAPYVQENVVVKRGMLLGTVGMADRTAGLGRGVPHLVFDLAPSSGTSLGQALAPEEADRLWHIAMRG